MTECSQEKGNKGSITEQDEDVSTGEVLPDPTGSSGDDATTDETLRQRVFCTLCQVITCASCPCDEVKVVLGQELFSRVGDSCNPLATRSHRKCRKTNPSWEEDLGGTLIASIRAEYNF